MGKEIRISPDFDMKNQGTWTRARNVMRKLAADQETWGKWALAATKLTGLTNEWLSDDDQTSRKPEPPINEEESAPRILPSL